MAKLPPVNGALLEIAAPGAGEDYDLAADPGGPPRWSGRAPAHATERTLTEVAGGRLDQVVEARLVIPTDLGANVMSGDLVTWERNGVLTTRRVRSIEEHADFGFQRLHLWDE